jgi:hypothetical protein
MKVQYALLELWYDGDSWLVDDSLVAISTDIEKLKLLAFKELKADNVYLPDEIFPDDGNYEHDERKRYRIVKILYNDNNLWKIII